MQTYGYCRISTEKQHCDRQFHALIAAGVPPENIFTDKLSGKDFERPNYKRLLRKLKRGDRLIITALDRLGREYTEMIEQWRHITKDLHADITVLDMSLLDTTNRKDLLGTFITDIVLQILSYVAQNERETMLTRQAEGIAAARKRGVKFGRPPKPPPSDFDRLKQDYQAKQISSRKAAKLLNVSQCTFLNWTKK